MGNEIPGRGGGGGVGEYIPDSMLSPSKRPLH